MSDPQYKSMTRMQFLYVLKLQGDKFYIGKSAQLQARLQGHFNGTATSWTKLHAPQEAILVRPLQSDFEEDNTTLTYMAEHGIENVRGGSWCEPNLSQSDKSSILKQITHTQGRCFKCGGKGHMAKNCLSTSMSQLSISVTPRSPSPTQSSTSSTSSWESINHTVTCFRCGRKGHYATNCYARRHVNGKSL